MKLSYILESIDLGTIALPEFQRGYVWSREQVRGLMQSLYQRYPVGSLLLWETRVGTTATRGSSAPESGTVTLLLDGQQRITSLYGIARGRPPEFFDGNPDVFTGLHFNVDDETFEFYRPSKMSGNPVWVDVTKLMQGEAHRWMERLADRPQPMKLMERLLRLKGVLDYEFRDESLSGDDKTVEVVVEIFNRVNSGGTKLSKGDLALAKICAEWPEGRKVMRDRLDHWREAGFDFTLDWLLRTAHTAITGKALFADSREADTATFENSLDQARDAIDTLLNLVAGRLGLDHDRVLAGTYAFPVMTRLVLQQGGKLANARDQDRLLYWYIHTFLWGRYSAQTDTMISRDLKALDQDGIDGLIRELERSRGTLRVRAEDFDTWSVGARTYPLLYLLTRTHRARDWGTGDRLSAHLLGRRSRLELHHIFPKALLYECEYGRPEVNAVANFCFLTQGTNLDIGRRAPEDYLPEIAAAYPGALESQWIPPNRELWRVERYREFLAARRALLADTANAFLDDLLHGRAEAARPAPADVLALPHAEAPESSEDAELRALADWIAGLGLAKPEIGGDVVDEYSGEVQASADALWRNGLQEGLSEPVALLLDRDEDMESRLGALGFRFFTSIDALRRHVQELIGEADEATPPLALPRR